MQSPTKPKGKSRSGSSGGSGSGSSSKKQQKPINRGPGARLASRKYVQQQQQQQQQHEGGSGNGNGLTSSLFAQPGSSFANQIEGDARSPRSPSSANNSSSKKKKKKGDNTLDEEEILSRPGRLLVDATDSVILMAFALDPMHLTLERSNSRQVLVPSLVAETTDPSWRFNLFQTPSPLKFSQATGRSADWKPPHLLTWSSWLEGRENNDSQESNGQDSGAQEVLARAPFASWTGIIDRVELVSILKRCVNCHGQQLVEREIEYAVKMFESLEQSMQREQWDSSFRCAVDLVWRFPNFALAYFKAGLCLALRMRNRQTTKRHRAQDTNGNASSANSSAAENGAAGTRNAQGGTNPSVSDRMHASFEHAYGNVSNLVKSLDPTRSAQADGNAAGAMDDDGVEAEMLKRSKDDYSLSPLVLEEIAHFWRCASLIEPHNSHLNGLIDLALRLSTGVFVSRIHMYRDPGLFPRSLGDAVALALLEQAPTRN